MEQQQEKTTRLKAWLDEHKIEYDDGPNKHNHVQTLFLTDYKITVYDASKLYSEDSVFKKTVKAHAQPFFIRETDTSDFVIEKMENTIAKRNLGRKRKFEKTIRRRLEEERIWYKLNSQVRRILYQKRRWNFYVDFINRFETEFGGDYAKTLESYYKRFDAKYRPKPKRKRVHFVAVRPHAEKV